MLRQLLLVSTLCILSTACIKTAEQVQRERRFESISEQMSDSQGLVADISAQVKELQSQLDRMNGRLEELEHQQGQIDPQMLKGLNENLSLIKAQQETQSQQMLAIQTELHEQRAFIEKVTATLSTMGQNQNSSSAHSKKKSAKEELTAGLDLVTKNKFSEAHRVLGPLLESKELSAGDMNKLYHGLGRVEFFTKNYEKALVYFSKIYTKYPKSSLAPSSLLFIGKSLAKLGKKAEAKEALDRLIEDYPQTKEASLAKKGL